MLKRWIANGAAYEPHWAFMPIERPALPAVNDTSWPRNAIDHFILSRLEHEQRQPAPPAAPATLLRRATFGVTGLPPTLKDVVAFEAQHDDASYKAMRERLLASTQYGEHPPSSIS